MDIYIILGNCFKEREFFNDTKVIETDYIGGKDETPQKTPKGSKNGQESQEMATRAKAQES